MNPFALTTDLYQHVSSGGSFADIPLPLWAEARAARAAVEKEREVETCRVFPDDTTLVAAPSERLCHGTGRAAVTADEIKTLARLLEGEGSASSLEACIAPAHCSLGALSLHMLAYRLIEARLDGVVTLSVLARQPLPFRVELADQGQTSGIFRDVDDAASEGVITYRHAVAVAGFGRIWALVVSIDDDMVLPRPLASSPDLFFFPRCHGRPKS